MRVLVTDAEYKLTVGAIRSLGRRGADVIAGAASRRAQGFLSRYCRGRVVYPSPETEGDRFVDAVLEIVEAETIDVVLPIGYASSTALSSRRDELRGRVAIPVAPWSAMEVAASKGRTLEHAAALGVPIPRTFSTPDDVDRFPVVVKASMGSGDVRYVNDRAELDAAAGPDSVIQEYVQGEGRGLFALFDEGRHRAVFMHRRIRELPVTGGASTAAESIFSPELRDLGLELLRSLSWHGVAMAEFKLDRRDGTHKLIELNPKFWGSLDLAIAAGVDFPWLAVQTALGEPFETVDGYVRGLRHQWVFSDLLHAAARPADLPAVLRDLADPRVRKDVWLRDLRPSLAEGGAAGRTVLRRARDPRWRRPHGIPSVRRPQE